MIPSSMKTSCGFRECLTCKQQKHVAEFYANKNRSDGFSSECKNCTRERTKRNAVERDKRLGITRRAAGHHINEVGNVYGYWTVIERTTRPSWSNESGTWWSCRCECGEIHPLPGGRLRAGRFTNGCDRCSGRGMKRVQNGICTRTYNTWRAMRARCLNPNDNAYSSYGGIGVKLCTRWNDFGNFLSDMGPRPAGKTLDRIDPFGDYSPENCRWADNATQSRNRRDSLTITEEQKILIKKIRDQGVSALDLGALLGVTRWTIDSIILDFKRRAA